MPSELVTAPRLGGASTSTINKTIIMAEEKRPLIRSYVYLTGLLVIVLVGLATNHSRLTAPLLQMATFKEAAAGRSKPRIAEPEIPEAAAEQARKFVLSRRAEYHEKGLQKRWKLRGVGYLLTRHNLILLAQTPKDPAVGTTQNVTIHNVSNETFAECDKFTIWVRVNGPEIFAGAAEPVTSPTGAGCSWTHAFDLRVAGTYEVDVKLLGYNGDAPISEAWLAAEEGLPEDMDKWKHDGFKGFKMYSRTKMCSEICARTPHCVHWATPFLRLPKPEKANNGCELFFERSAPDEYVPVSKWYPPTPVGGGGRRRRLEDDWGKPYHGTRHLNQTSYFMGCGWSFWFTLDFQCVSGDLDDRVFHLESTFEALPAARGTPSAVDPDDSPPCALEHEAQGEASRGRWVREPWPNASACPPFEQHDAQSFPLTKFDDDHPHCWNREDISVIGIKCLEMNCGLIEQSSLWRSSLHRETEFMGSWQPYSCRYREFTTRQLQECVTKRKILAFKKKGNSIAHFWSRFVDYRLENVTMYSDAEDPGAITVVYDTLMTMARAELPDRALTDEIEALAVAPPEEEHYYGTGFFLSSEREVHTHLARTRSVIELIGPIAEEKKYRTMNAFDLTAAFTYDAATQNDGMHIIGPPMKMLTTKLFHHVCSDALAG